jgi:hypothetical protein
MFCNKDRANYTIICIKAISKYITKSSKVNEVLGKIQADLKGSKYSRVEDI